MSTPSDFEVRAREIAADHAPAAFCDRLAAAIAKAIEDAVREAEAPLIEKIGKQAQRIQALEDIKFNLEKAVKSKPIPWAHDVRVTSAIEEERERCAKIADDHELASRENGFSDAADVAQQLASAIRNQKDQSDA